MRNWTILTWCAAVLFMALDARGEDQRGAPGVVEAEIEVTPDALDFGQVDVGVFSMLELGIASVGQDVLFVENITIEDSDLFSFDDSMTERIMAPGASTTLEVTFEPTEDGETSGTLRLVSNDPDLQVLQVPLWGVGVGPGDDDGGDDGDDGEDDDDVSPDCECRAGPAGSGPAWPLGLLTLVGVVALRRRRRRDERVRHFHLSLHQPQKSCFEKRPRRPSPISCNARAQNIGVSRLTPGMCNSLLRKIGVRLGGGRYLTQVESSGNSGANSSTLRGDS